MESFVTFLSTVANDWHTFINMSSGMHFMVAMNTLLVMMVPLFVGMAFHMLRHGYKFAFRYYMAFGSMALVTGTSQLLARLGSPSWRDIGDLLGIAIVVPIVFMIMYMSRAIRELRIYTEAQKAKKAAKPASPADAWPPAPAAK
jgi:hypothetical protein